MTNLSGATTAVFIIKLSAALGIPVNVAWETKDGTAKAGTDYEAASGSVAFAVGETQKQIQVVVYGRDAGSTEARKFSILLYPPENAILDQTLTEIDIQVTDSDGVAVTSLVVATGPRGLKGEPGLSAYELAKLQGYAGTLQEWLESQNPAAAMLQKTLRVSESSIPMLPNVEERKNKILAFDNSGSPMVTLPESGSAADVLIELAKPSGARKSGLKQGGTVQDAIVSVYVDSFGADPTGKTSSTAAVNAALAAINMLTDSRMNGEVSTTYAELVFGNGRYIVGDIPLKSGVSYRGQGAFATVLMPEAGATWVFKTIGTMPHETHGSPYRLFRTTIKDMHIGCGLQNVFSDYSIPTGVGAIYIAHASYVNIENVYIRHMDGPGVRFESLWDSDTYNVRIMYVGNTRDMNNPAWAWYVGAGSAPTDGSNANRFLKTHIEGCPANICADLRSRHNFFLGGKIESVRSNDPTKYSSSLIRGVDGLVFANMELSWSNIGKFMFEGVGTTTLIDTSEDDVSDPNCDHSRGVVFLNTIIIDSNALSGDYFRYKSGRGVLRIAGGYARHCRYLFSGSDMRISHLEMVQCGPTLGLLQGNVVIDGVDVSRSRVLSSGTFSAFTATGNGNIVRNSEFGTPYGGPGDGNSWFTINSSTGIDFQNILFNGALQNGISGSTPTQQRRFRNIRLGSGASYGSLINGGYAFDGLPTRIIAETGLAVTNKVTVPVDTSFTVSDVIGGASEILIRIENSSGAGIAAGKIFCDASFAQVLKLADIQGNIGINASGVSGDGKVYFSSSSSILTIVNRTSGPVFIYLLSLNAK